MSRVCETCSGECWLVAMGGDDFLSCTVLLIPLQLSCTTLLYNNVRRAVGGVLKSKAGNSSIVPSAGRNNAVGACEAWHG